MAATCVPARNLARARGGSVPTGAQDGRRCATIKCVLILLAHALAGTRRVFTAAGAFCLSVAILLQALHPLQLAWELRLHDVTATLEQSCSRLFTHCNPGTFAHA